MPHELTRILRAVAMTPWAICEERLQTITEVLLRRHAEGPAGADVVAERLLQSDRQRELVVPDGHRVVPVDVTQLFRWPADHAVTVEERWLCFDQQDENEDRQRRQDAADRPRKSAPGQVAVLPLFGVISNRIHTVQDISGPGGTSAEGFANRVRQAAANPDTKAIVLDIDSPGGTVDGTPEAAQAVFDAREQTHVVAMVNANAHSAAYWIASQADEVVVTPSGMVGNIGVRTAHLDESAALEAKGVKVTVVSAGKFKSELLPFGPLSDEAREALQERVNAAYAMFTADVARGRGVKPAEVRDGFGQGRSVDAKTAVKEGMADRIGTMGDVLERLGVGRQAQPRGARAEDTTQAVLAERGLMARRRMLPRI